MHALEHQCSKLFAVSAMGERSWASDVKVSQSPLWWVVMQVLSPEVL